MIKQIFNNNVSSQTAVITETGNLISYSTLSADIKKVSILLKNRDLIFILCRNDYVSLLFYLAALDVGAVPLLLNAESQSGHLSRLLELYSPKYVLSAIELVETYVNLSPSSQHGNSTLYKNTVSTSPKLHKDLAFLATTSGSTGDPKLVRLSLDNLKSNAVSIVEYLSLTPEDRAITSLPISYSYGLSVINSHLLAGATVVLSDFSFMEKGFWEKINTHEVTSFAGVPYHYEMLLRLGLKRLKIPTINKMTQAGGRLDSEKIEKVYSFCKDNGIRFWTMYGQTEASPRMSYLPCEETLQKLGSIGRPVAGGKLWIKGKNEDDISSTGEIGELIYEGNNVCMGYALNQADLALGDLNQGLLSTGDLARCDEDGRFYIEGRLKRFIKVYGNRISLDQIEAFLGESGIECASHGHDDNLIVHIVAEQGYNMEEIKRNISVTSGVHINAITVIIVNELPRLATGKIDYQCLAKTT